MGTVGHIWHNLKKKLHGMFSKSKRKNEEMFDRHTNLFQFKFAYPMDAPMLFSRGARAGRVHFWWVHFSIRSSLPTVFPLAFLADRNDLVNGIVNCINLIRTQHSVIYSPQYCKFHLIAMFLPDKKQFIYLRLWCETGSKSSWESENKNNTEFHIKWWIIVRNGIELWAERRSL